ncbi:AAA family ATPase [Enterococcus faecalis]|uniref:AAA family ATPase n=1 Tax=Enterococcus faecalis TaxID=1351 RepID=UPI001144DC81|nr:ATP-dependent Clp protease ATP-binding subunit [Enterococcus faecalis]TQB60933.1 ATP-dependent Clp protease ATP-binding subunit [Enterococcus faecalis]
MSYLEKYTLNLNQKLRGSPVQVYCREKEIEQIIEYLSLKKKSNPMLVGEAGVGKTAVVEGIVQKIINHTVPELLKDTTIYSLEISSLMSTENSPDFLLKEIIKEIQLEKAILFIDEIHTIVSNSQNSQSMNFSNTLKPALARGEVKIIGATTIEEYHQYLTKDRALTRRFNKVTIGELTTEQVVNVLMRSKASYKKHYRIEIQDSMIELCCAYANRYIHNNQFPDKAFDVLDEALSVAYLKQDPILKEEHIQQAVAQRTNITIKPLDNKEEIKNLLNLEDYLKKYLKGQDHVIKEVSDYLVQAIAGFRNEEKPLASFLFLGTTGVGKTELAKRLRDFFFPNNPLGMFRFDMSEYGDQDTALTKLIGDSHTDGSLIRKIQENPYSILLFDEIEKAHKDVFNVFLQLLDEGRLSDRFGREINFNHAIIVFTTNLGAELIVDKQDYSSIAVEDESKDRAFKKQMEAELTNVFKPELLNRIDKKLTFNVLDKQSIYEIIKMKLEPVRSNLDKEGIKLSFDENKVFNYLLRVGYDKYNGARPIERTVSEYISIPLSKIVLTNRLEDRVIKEVLITTQGNPPSKTDRYGDEKIRIRIKKG